MSKPTEADLRRAKDNAHRVVTEQQRQLGVPNPGGRVVEDFVNPILEKLAKGTDPAPVTEPEPAAPQAHGDDIQTAVVGEYDWDLATDKVTGRPGSWAPSPEDRLREFIRFLFAQPEAGNQLRATVSICSKHHSMKKGCAYCERREERFRHVVRQCAVKYGYGAYRKNPTIYTGTKAIK